MGRGGGGGGRGGGSASDQAARAAGLSKSQATALIASRAEFQSGIDNITRRGRPNAADAQYARLAQTAINEAFLGQYNSSTGKMEFTIRPGVSPEKLGKARQLLGMGISEAVNGRGRSLLQKR